MRTAAAFFNLVAAVAATQFLHYTVPAALSANTNCSALPAKFVVTNFSTLTDNASTEPSTVSFGFFDPDTKIAAACGRDATSTATGPSKNIYPCDNADVSFIYQTTGIAGLTLIEKACSGQSTVQYEASGLVQPDLVCKNTTSSSSCVASPSSIDGTFDSFEPVPPAVPKRRVKATWRG